MMLILTMIFILTLIMMMMMMIATIISKKSFKDREKSSPFECGFDPKNSARLPFSIHFFLIALIFLIFDVEITLILPFIYSMKISNLTLMIFNISLFLSILILGLYHEWNQGALNWSF
uniref:NADH-ubiquinone oxidoreductase chain 3 n=1 Tax=Hippodamia variegata TaxID=703264 RepID=A0A6C0UBN2_9CUCU|nr:NADH dehydrogenase subunit 3 [Hippodamia variegata]QIB71483.1 NADH dehydrogenase subunit 3 [Hippodamia variegata]